MITAILRIGRPGVPISQAATNAAICVSDESSRTIARSSDPSLRLAPARLGSALRVGTSSDDTGMDRRERMQKARTIQQDGEAKTNPIVDDEQKKKWEEIRNENRQEMMKRRGGRNPQ